MESLSKHNNPSVFQTEKHMIEQGFWFGVKESKSRCKVVTTRAGKWMKLTFCEGPWHQSLQGLHQFEQPLPAAAGTASHPERQWLRDLHLHFSHPAKKKKKIIIIDMTPSQFPNFL